MYEKCEKPSVWLRLNVFVDFYLSNNAADVNELFLYTNLASST